MALCLLIKTMRGFMEVTLRDVFFQAGSCEYDFSQENIDILMKVELITTQTAISPFSSVAGNGFWWRYRDGEGANGIGSKPKAG